MAIQIDAHTLHTPLSHAFTKHFIKHNHQWVKIPITYDVDLLINAGRMDDISNACQNGSQ